MSKGEAEAFVKLRKLIEETHEVRFTRGHGMVVITHGGHWHFHVDGNLYEAIGAACVEWKRIKNKKVVREGVNTRLE